MKRRMLSLLLCVAILLSMLAVYAFPSSAATYGNLTYEIEDGKVTITDCNGYITGALSIPAEIEGYPVTSIGSRAFYNYYYLKSITLPNSITSIGEGAFEKCDSLESITLPNGITSIGEYVFRWCDSLKNITLPNSITSIGESAFEGCSSLESITFPNSITSIGKYAFDSCDSLKNITLPKSITSLGYSAFGGCSSLESITIPGSIKTVDDYFSHCTNLKTVIFLDGVTTVKFGAFFSCPNVERVTIPKSMKSINYDAFYFLKDSKCDVYYGGNMAQSKPISVGWTAPHTVWHYDACINQVNHRYSSTTDLVCNVCGFTRRATQPATRAHTPSVFKDVKKSDWFFKNGAIDFVYNEGLFSGIEKTTFSPNGKMTRAMFVTVLGRLDGAVVNNNTTTRFTDVAKQQYYTGYVKWASDNNLVSGVTDAEFSPNANITREQICAIMVRYSTYAKITLQKKNAAIKFKDANKISSYAQSAVTDCQRAGLVTGNKVSGGYAFRPKGNATRAEVATILMNFANQYDVHEWYKSKTAKTSTCISKTTYKCNHCTQSKTVLSSAHTISVLAKVAPTCTKAGKTAGVKCTTCKTVFATQKTVAAKGHSWKAATCTTPKKCKICGTTTGGAAGHKLKNNKCTVCGKDFTPASAKTKDIIYQNLENALSWTQRGIDAVQEYKPATAVYRLLMARKYFNDAAYGCGSYYDLQELKAELNAICSALMPLDNYTSVGPHNEDRALLQAYYCLENMYPHLENMTDILGVLVS